MANTTPTKVTFLRGFWLCLLLLFAPGKFKQAQDSDNAVLASAHSAATTEDLRHMAVRRAFASSFLLVLISAAVGYGSAYLAAVAGSCSLPKAVSWLQLIGACLLPWGTLFVRGWEVQTIGGVSLTERVNHWLYRGLYCVGTAIIVFSLAWPACPAVG